MQGCCGEEGAGAGAHAPLYTLSEEEGEHAAAERAERSRELQRSWDHSSALHSAREDVLDSVSDLSD